MLDYNTVNEACPLLAVSESVQYVCTGGYSDLSLPVYHVGTLSCPGSSVGRL